MKNVIFILAFCISAFSYAQKNILEKNQAHSQKQSESINILMYSPSQAEHDLLFRIYIPTGGLSGKYQNAVIDSKFSGFLSSLEYGYGVTDNFSLGLAQSLLNNYTLSTSGVDTVYSGLGDTTLIAKFIVAIDNLSLYFSGQERMALLAKPTTNLDTHENTVVSDRNLFNLDIGADYKFDRFNFGSMLTLKFYQSGKSEEINSGVTTSNALAAGRGHDINIFGQLNLENLKLGLNLNEAVTYEYTSVKSTGLSTTTYTASTSRQIMLYSIIPFADKFEGHLGVIKFIPKDNPYDLTYDYYFLTAALRTTF